MNKMGKQYHTVGTIPNSNILIVEKEDNSIPLPHIHDAHFLCLVQALQ